MEVDVEDVQVELEQGVGPSTDAAESGWQVPQHQGFDPQYVKHLFTSSIQAAVALVRDAEDGTTRATRRITILLHLMEGGMVAHLLFIFFFGHSFFLLHFCLLLDLYEMFICNQCSSISSRSHHGEDFVTM